MLKSLSANPDSFRFSRPGKQRIFWLRILANSYGKPVEEDGFSIHLLTVDRFAPGQLPRWNSCLQDRCPRSVHLDISKHLRWTAKRDYTNHVPSRRQPRSADIWDFCRSSRL